jgi:hypothetical protein
LTHEKAGLTPNWKREELNFQLCNVELIHFRVMDFEPSGNHDFVAGGVMKAARIPAGRNMKNVSIHYDERGIKKLGGMV